MGKGIENLIKRKFIIKNKIKIKYLYIFFYNMYLYGFLVHA